MPTIPSWLYNALLASDAVIAAPTAYGPFHLTFFAVGLGLSILLAWLLRNRSPKTIRIILFCIGAALCLSEIWKQLLHYYCYAPQNTYKWHIFPFQLCSVPMYLCLIAPSIRQGRVSRALYTFMMLYNLLGGLMAFVEPTAINHSNLFLLLHSYFWHILLIFVGLLMMTTDFGGRTLKDYVASSITFVALCGMAVSLNVIFREASGKVLNNFEIGPSIPSLPVFSDVWNSCGWYASAALYIFALCLGAFVIFLPIHLWDRRKTRLAAAVCEEAPAAEASPENDRVAL